MNEEQQLIRRVIARRPAAEEEFVRRYSGLVLGLARGRFGLAGDAAEDVLQSTMEKLWNDDFRALRAWRGHGRFTSYLTVIVTHMLLRRREVQERRHEEAVDPGNLVDTADAAQSPTPRTSRSPSGHMPGMPALGDAGRPGDRRERRGAGSSLASEKEPPAYCGTMVGRRGGRGRHRGRPCWPQGARAVVGPETNAAETGLALKAFSAIAYAHHQLGNLTAARAAYERILELAWKVNDQRLINFAYCNRAEVRWQLGDERPVEEDLRRAIVGWEAARGRVLGTADQRADFLAVQVAAYDRLIRYLAETSRGAEAFEIAERFHARSFLEMLDHPPLLALGSRLPVQWQHRQDLVSEIGRLRLHLEDESGEGGPHHRRLERLEGELQAVEARLIHGTSKPAVTPVPTLEAVQAGLEPGEALVAYWLTDERVLAWSVFEGAVRFVQVPIPRPQLEQRVHAYLELLRSPRRAEDAALRGHEANHLAIGRELYGWLVAALPPEVLAARRLIVVPDGILHYLPFESLVSRCDGEADAGTIHGIYGTCRYLGLETSLAYSASAGALLSLRQRRNERPADALRENELLAFAPRFGADATPELGELRDALGGRLPLVHARDEVRRIADHFTGASLRLDRQATESRLKREAHDYRLLHLATHGLVSDEHPMSSGVLLLDGDGEDGLLQAHEVLGLELDADIVTLSACRTGRGKLRRGEGIVGLSRAFLTAGASSVVVSLWDVDDRSTPQLMEVFYEKIAAGTAAPEAMLAARRALFTATTEAKLVFRTRPLAYAHPRFWASFVVLGGP